MNLLPPATWLVLLLLLAYLAAEAHVRSTRRWQGLATLLGVLLAASLAATALAWGAAGQILIASAMAVLALVPAALAWLRLFGLGTRLTRSRRLFRALATFDPAAAEFALEPTAHDNPFDRPRRIHEPLSIQTKDKVSLRGTLIKSNHRRVIVIAHGAFRSKNTLPYVLLAQWLAYSYDVALFDFRGHGESDGRFDFSEKTAEDVRAVVAHVRGLGYNRVGVFGRSMGAWSALIAAGTQTAADDPARIDSLVAAASPLRQITSIDTAQFFRRWLEVPLLGWLFKPVAQLVVNVTRGNRVGGITDSAVCPIDVAARIRAPVFVIYQEWDVVIKTNIADANAMFAALPEPKRLLLLAGPGHIFEIASFHRVCREVELWFDATLGPETSVA